MADSKVSSVERARLTIDGIRGDLASTAQDARLASLDAAHLGPAVEGYRGVQAQLARREEAAQRARTLAKHASERADVAEQKARQLEDQLAQARQELDDAGTATSQAQDEARHAQTRADQALRALSHAGAGCGPATSMGALEGELWSAVRGARQRAVADMAARALAVEVAWQLGKMALGDRIERALQTQGAQDVGSAVDGIVDIVRETHPVMREQVVEALQTARNRLGL